MPKKVILLIHNEKIEVYNTLTGLCKIKKEFSYSYMKGLKFPFTYKKYNFIQKKVN